MENKNILIEMLFDFIDTIECFFKNNLITFANALNTILPYLMFYIGQYVALDRNKVSAGGEIFVPLVFIIIIYFLRTLANKIGKGITVPIPDKRFTEVDNDGEVSIENNRLQELLLYTADLEDWLEKKGLL